MGLKGLRAQGEIFSGLVRQKLCPLIRTSNTMSEWGEKKEQLLLITWLQANTISMMKHGGDSIMFMCIMKGDN